MRGFLQAASKASVALVNSGSIAVAIGAVTTIMFGRLTPGIFAGVMAFVLASSAFGYFIWRSHRPRTSMFFARR